jgi:hypothetical protein
VESLYKDADSPENSYGKKYAKDAYPDPPDSFPLVFWDVDIKSSHLGVLLFGTNIVHFGFGAKILPKAESVIFVYELRKWTLWIIMIPENPGVHRADINTGRCSFSVDSRG